MDYTFCSDDLEEKGFISKDFILKYVSQEDIFEWVFGYKPIYDDYVTSPFREDKHPGCWFEERVNGEIRFTDFGNNSKYKTIDMQNIDCFDAVMVAKQLPNFYKTLEFIKSELIDKKGKITPLKPKKIQTQQIIKTPTIIQIVPRNFNLQDRDYWSQFFISKQNLIDDKVLPLSRFYTLNEVKGTKFYSCKSITYAFTEFLGNRMKIYMPKSDYRFITNCGKDDIGSINHLTKFGDTLIISKSYKDCRILRNLGLHSIWFQNEGMRPNFKEVYNLCRRFEKVVVFFDNDQAGIKASMRIINEINAILPGKATNIHLPIELYEQKSIKDPGDLVKAEQTTEGLINFLKHHNLL